MGSTLTPYLRNRVLSGSRAEVLRMIGLLLLLLIVQLAPGTGRLQSETGTAHKSTKRASPSPQVNSAASNFEELKAKADAAREADQIPEAIQLYTQLVKIRPKWSEGWWYLGTLYYDTDQYASGAVAFQQFSALEPQNGQGWAMWGLCEYQTKNHVSSLQHLSKARALGLGGNEDLARVTRYHQAILLTRGKQFEAAQALLEGFAVEHRESEAVLDALGMAVLRIADPLESLTQKQREMTRQFGKAAFLAGERKLPEARQLYDELEARYRNEPNVAYAFGVWLLLDREPEKALASFRKELERDPKHLAALLQIAYQAIAAGNFADGLPVAKKAIEIEPDHFPAHYALGRIYLELGEVSQAVSALEKAAALAPDSANVQFVLARAYSKAKRPADAARARAQFAAKIQALDKKRQGGEAVVADDIPTESQKVEKP